MPEIDNIKTVTFDNVTAILAVGGNVEEVNSKLLHATEEINRWTEG